MRRIIKSLILLLGILKMDSISAQAESKLNICFNPKYGNTKIVLNDSSKILRVSDSLCISSLKFYISKIELFYNTNKVWSEENSFHLVDVSDSNSLQVALNTPKDITFNFIKFYLGIDSITNVSGALGGNLDPTKGMYWTWQSGYINFKLEGKSKFCNTRNYAFQFHLGGYQNPFCSWQTVILKVTGSDKIIIKLDLFKFFEFIDLPNHMPIMSPCLEASSLSKKLIKIFEIE